MKTPQDNRAAVRPARGEDCSRVALESPEHSASATSGTYLRAVRPGTEPSKVPAEEATGSHAEHARQPVARRRRWRPHALTVARAIVADSAWSIDVAERRSVARE